MVVENIKYPIYIVSKGRWENPITAKAFIRDQIPFKIAVEPQEYDNYCNSVGSNRVLKLPFSNLGLGSYPARNHCREDSIKNGFEKHFLFDDNIYGFDYFYKGKTNKCESVKPIVSLQNFTERYRNVAISGFNYDGFVLQDNKKPFYINTHVYSAMLIKNDLKNRWRLKYNEDIDLCLQVLDEGHCTILFNTYCINKVSTTSKLKGGNQDELYKNNAYDKKVLKAQSLEKIWPQYAKTVMRFGRPHHQVSWNKFFKQPLIRKSNYHDIVKQQVQLGFS